jgi:ribonuclease BN (tRNA processing enzyme)
MMGYKLFLIFNHQLTSDQKEDAYKNLNVERFIYLPPELQKLWSNIPPQWDLKEIEENILIPIKKFIIENSQEGDRVLIQGDFGAVCKLVQFAKGHNLVPLYATTKREVEEKREGDKIKKISTFKHIRFREF